MLIQRTYKDTSNNRGFVATVSYATLRKVLGQTEVAFHGKGDCGKPTCEYCPEIALAKFIKDGVIETYFSKFELVNTDV